VESVLKPIRSDARSGGEREVGLLYRAKWPTIFSNPGARGSYQGTEENGEERRAGGFVR